MRRVVERHLAKLRRAREAPEELAELQARSIARMYPPAPATVRAVKHERIPADAPDWYFEDELRRSGLWDMMERCYPSAHAQSQ
jgi:hypothetical protein